jgi:hypothetical protein
MTASAAEAEVMSEKKISERMDGFDFWQRNGLARGWFKSEVFIPLPFQSLAKS